MTMPWEKSGPSTTMVARLVGGPDDGQTVSREVSAGGLLPLLGSSDRVGGYWPTTERTDEGEIIYRFRASAGTESPTHGDLRKAMFGEPSLWPNIDPEVNARNEAAVAAARTRPETGFHLVRPEVPGGLGDEAELHQRPPAPPLVTRLHFEFGYLGREVDDLFTSHPVYLVTTRLADALRGSRLSGFELRSDLKVTVDPQVAIVDPGWVPPSVQWLVVTGTPGGDDLGLTEDASLVVSDLALRLLRGHRLEAADIEPYG
jgi:hypothetical protein